MGKAIYKTKNENAAKTVFAISEDTNNMLNVIAAFDRVSDELGRELSRTYGVAGDQIIEGYFDAAESAKKYLYDLLIGSIAEEMGTNGNLI